MLVDMDQANRVLSRAVESVLPGKESLEKLLRTKKIRVYLGVDPTGSHLHLGHTIPMRKLQEFADLGHEAILLFGTGTVLAGDPSQRSATRQKITQKEIDENIKTWKSQASKVVDFNKVQIKQNGDWLLKLTYADIIKIASHISAIQLFKRDMFQKRLKRGDTIWTHETLYPLFQGYDSVAMDVDLEIGGTDQTFNMLCGRELQKKMKNREKYVLTTPLISGTDGQPMSKTSGNCIWLDDSPQDMYGKIMSMSDLRIGEYWINLTNLNSKELTDLKHLDAKKKLAHEIVRIYHSQNQADKAQEQFEKTFQKGQAPQDIQVITINQPVVDLSDFLFNNKLAGSRSAAKRLIEQGAIEIDGEIIKTPQVEFKDANVVKIGKRKFVKVTLRT